MITYLWSLRGLTVARGARRSGKLSPFYFQAEEAEEEAEEEEEEEEAEEAEEEAEAAEAARL